MDRARFRFDVIHAARYVFLYTPLRRSTHSLTHLRTAYRLESSASMGCLSFSSSF